MFLSPPTFNYRRDTLPARPETVAVVGEGRVEHRLQHLEHRLLDEPVEHRGNAQLAHAPAGFRNLDAFHR